MKSMPRPLRHRSLAQAEADVDGPRTTGAFDEEPTVLPVRNWDLHAVSKRGRAVDMEFLDLISGFSR